MSYKRKRDENRRLRKLYEQTHKHSYAFGGAWYNPRKGRYVRVTSSNRSGYPKRLRQMCNMNVASMADARMMPSDNIQDEGFEAD